MSKINLPSILTEDTWFYKERPEDQHRLKHLLGKPYISYSTISSFFEYTEDFIKSKIVGVRDEVGIYGDFGTYWGETLEKGTLPKENPHGFKGAELFDVDNYRTKGSEYERMIVIEQEGYFVIGFIDQLIPEPDGTYTIRDQKTGGKGKEEGYKKEDYIQTVLYAHALELEGLKIKGTEILFLRRVGSHVNPPLALSGEMFLIPLEYNKERVKYALAKVDKAVKGITELKNTYDKIFS